MPQRRYLIGSIVFGQLNEHSFSFRDFYAKRIKRIFPAVALVDQLNRIYRKA
jgi:peptidoglycan/LPS O-acetylase OafA/YrhL